MRYLIIVLFFLLAACSKLEQGEQTYTIEAGKHYASPRYVAQTSDVSFDFYVDTTWYYPASHDVGWSKLTGLSHNANPHGNSGRIGWRCRKGTEIHLSGYFYLNKHRYIYELGQYAVGWHSGRVWFDGKRYNVEVNGQHVSHFAEWSGTANNYLCHPYFGGQLAAPHKIMFYFNF